MDKQNRQQVVCDCSAESGLSVSAKEVLAVLQSHRIPDVHPLREYVLNCHRSPNDTYDWIGWIAQQVKVEGGEAEQQVRAFLCALQYVANPHCSHFGFRAWQT